jgi:hypothetical protein
VGAASLAASAAPAGLEHSQRIRREALRDPVIFDTCYETFRDAWLGSADGVFADAEIYVQPWGFAPEDIKVPGAYLARA